MSIGSWARGEASAKYVAVSLDIAGEVERLLCKEDLFPKRQRWLSAKKIADASNMLMFYSIHANETKAVTLEESEDRHRDLTRALAALRTLDVLLFYTIRRHGLNADRFENLARMMNSCEKLLNGVLNKELRHMDALKEKRASEYLAKERR